METGLTKKSLKQNCNGNECKLDINFFGFKSILKKFVSKEIDLQCKVNLRENIFPVISLS